VAYEAFVAWVEARGLGVPGLAVLLGGWIALWGLVAGGVTAWAFRRRRVAARLDRALERGTANLPLQARATSRGEAVRGAVADLARPSFWLPVLLVAAVVLAVESSWERAFWIGVRAATVGLLLFTAARTLDPLKAALWLRRRGQWGPAEALGHALGARGRIKGGR
jgi:hypothetical protein